MSCPRCGAASTTEQAQRTALGYRKFRCQVCKRLFNERTGTPSRANSAEGRRPSTGPEKRSALRAGQQLCGGSRQLQEAASAESEGPFLPVIRRERVCVSWGWGFFTTLKLYAVPRHCFFLVGRKQASEPPFNCLEYPTDIVLLVVVWRLRYKLSLRDLAEMWLTRGFTFTHEAVRNWEARFAPLLAERLRAKRRGRGGVSWYADETYVKVQGR
jgi:hypothetical protein